MELRRRNMPLTLPFWLLDAAVEVSGLPLDMLFCLALYEHE